MTETVHYRPTLVLGGTGKTGRRLVERLTRRNIPVPTTAAFGCLAWALVLHGRTTANTADHEASRPAQTAPSPLATAAEDPR
jgi:hypothetical protein